MKTQTAQEYPLIVVLNVAILGALSSIVIGHAFQSLTGTLPKKTVFAERVIFDGPYERHVEMVELTIDEDFEEIL
jgi:hypothetical protein